MLFEGFKRLNVHLISIQKFSNFFVSLNKVVEIFSNFLRIIHQIISPISIFYAIWSLPKPKCLPNINPNVYLMLAQKFPNFFSSLYKTFGICKWYLERYLLDDISFTNFLSKLMIDKMIS